jgi:hypothetical protein
MITLGIDLSSMPGGTAACLIRWGSKGAVSDPPRLRCRDQDLDALIREADAVGIDAPFGWPMEFVAAVQRWTIKEWNSEVRDSLRFRHTDRAVQGILERPPLSVSTDRLALAAMRAMALLARHGVTDRSGDGRFFEVYPAASLHEWDLAEKGYKAAGPEGARKRRGILTRLCAKMPWLEVGQDYAKSGDSLDALVAALTARAVSTEHSYLPEPDMVPVAREEGWIHVPSALPRP